MTSARKGKKVLKYPKFADKLYFVDREREGVKNQKMLPTSDMEAP